MKKRMMIFLMCAVMLFSAAGCGGTQKTSESAAPAAEEKVSAKASVGQIAEAKVPEAETEVKEADVKEAVQEEAQADTFGSTEEYKEPGADSEAYDMQYAFVNIKIDNEGRYILFPNGTVGEDTALYNDKALGGLCDYIDENVLEEGRTINRAFLYDLVSVQIIDPQLISSYDRFNNTMMYCLTLANEFYSIDVRVEDLILNSAEQAKQVFEVVAAGKQDSWILDGHEMKFYLNSGNTEYSSSMFDAQTLAVWSFVLDEYYGETFGESQ